MLDSDHGRLQKRALYCAYIVPTYEDYRKLSSHEFKVREIQQILIIWTRLALSKDICLTFILFSWNFQSQLVKQKEFVYLCGCESLQKCYMYNVLALES